MRRFDIMKARTAKPTSRGTPSPTPTPKPAFAPLLNPVLALLTGVVVLSVALPDGTPVELVGWNCPVVAEGPVSVPPDPAAGTVGVGCEIESVPVVVAVPVSVALESHHVNTFLHSHAPQSNLT